MDKSPHVNYDIMIHPKGEAEQTQLAKYNSARKNQAKEFAYNSLHSSGKNTMGHFMETNHISKKKSGQRSGPGGYGCNAPSS